MARPIVERNNKERFQARCELVVFSWFFYRGTKAYNITSMLFVKLDSVWFIEIIDIRYLQ